MGQDLDDLNAAVARLEEDQVNVANAINGARGEIAVLTQEVDDLQAQIAAGTPATVEDLQAVTLRLDAIDAALDISAPPAEAKPPE